MPSSRTASSISRARLLVPLIAGGLLAAACGEDTEPQADAAISTDATMDDAGDTQTEDATDDAAPDAPDVQQDVAEDALPDDTTDEDTEQDVGFPVLNCDDDERQVADACRADFDRACFDDTHCRENETCQWLPDDDLERPGTCIYGIPEPIQCPGSPSCENADGELQAGFSARVITPRGWELPRPGWTEDPNEWGFDERFTGDVIDPDTFCDCGRDLVCPPTPEFEECYSIGEYVGPDADGTEGDGEMQGAWLAGFGNSRLAQICPEDWLAPNCDGPDCCDNPFAHDDIWARTTVLSKGDTRIAWVVVDTVGYFYSEVEQIRDALDPELGIDWLLVSATHTHEAPDTLGQWGPGSYGVQLPTTTGAEPLWMADLRQVIAESVAEAVGNLEDTDVYAMHVDTGPHEFAIRDTRNPFIFDDRITALRFVPQDADPSDTSNTLGTIINWHSHPEAMGGDNVFTSSDFPHYVRQYIEQGFAEASDAGDGRIFPARDGYGGVSMYISGSVGGLLNPLHRDVVGRDGVTYARNTYAKSHALGARLADLTLEALGRTCDAPGQLGCTIRIEDESLSFMSQELIVDVTNVNFQAGGISLGLFDRPIYDWRRRDGSRVGDNQPKLLSAITQMRLGNVAFQTFPGEPFPELTTGLHPGQIARDPIVGDWTDMNCDATHRVRLAPEDTGERFGCLIRENNPNPPQVDNFPTGQPLADAIGGDYLFIIGLGNDQLGYIIPPYDFQVDPQLGALVQVDGDHYEETASAGNMANDVLNLIHHINDTLAP